MDFRPTETQSILINAVTDLLAKEHNPQLRHTPHAISSDGSSPLWQKFAELGLLGIEVDEKYGGSGAAFEDLAAIMPAFGEALVVEPFIPTAVLGAGLIMAVGSEQQQAGLLPELVGGDLQLALAHGERASREMLSWVATTARPSAGGYVLNGAKAVVLGGDRAAIFLVSARTGGATGDMAGISLFLVPKDATGLTVRPYPLYDGTSGADLTLDGVALDHDALLGAPGEALVPISAAYDRAAAALAAEAVGVMAKLCDITVDYLKTRTQFGQPIGKFQVLQHRAVDMHLAVEMSRSMALLAVAGIANPDPVARAKSVSAAKVLIGKSARLVGQTAVQLHGGIALTDEYSAGHYFKRLTAIERLFGNVEYHLQRFAAVA